MIVNCIVQRQRNKIDILQNNNKESTMNILRKLFTTNFNYNKTYYKITNYEECHHRLQHHMG